VQPHGPYLLGGWSLGGLVAFEMAQQLQKQGEEVALLTLIDSRVPSAQSRAVEEDEATTLAMLFVDMSGVAGGLLSEDISEAFAGLQQLEGDARFAYVLKQASRYNLVPPHTDVSYIRRLVNVFSANRLAQRSYMPQSYAGRVVLFRARDEAGEPSGDNTFGWGSVAGHLETIDVPGDHYNILTGAQVHTLAARIKSYLARAQAASGASVSRPVVSAG
jgi:thioesterase domain-containing protein